MPAAEGWCDHDIAAGRLAAVEQLDLRANEQPPRGPAAVRRSLGHASQCRSSQPGSLPSRRVLRFVMFFSVHKSKWVEFAQLGYSQPLSMRRLDYLVDSVRRSFGDATNQLIDYLGARPTLLSGCSCDFHDGRCFVQAAKLSTRICATRCCPYQQPRPQQALPAAQGSHDRASQGRALSPECARLPNRRRSGRTQRADALA